MVTRGALKDLSPSKAEDTYRRLNIDRNSKRERTRAAEIQNRLAPQSAYDCDNSYRHLSVPCGRAQNFSQLMNYETTPMDKSLYGSACSTNYYYFSKLSMPQRGEIAPARSREGSTGPQHASTLSTFDARSLNKQGAAEDTVGEEGAFNVDGSLPKPGQEERLLSLDARRHLKNKSLLAKSKPLDCRVIAASQKQQERHEMKQSLSPAM